MVLNKLFRVRRPIAFFTLLSLLLLSVEALALPRTVQDEPVRVTNQEWKVEGNIVVVTFDLGGPSERIYSVSVVLLRDGDARFRLIPKSVKGNIGEDVSAGPGRKIVWDYRTDVPQGLAGEGYYFEIVARLQGTGGGNWLYYVLGGVAVAGGAAAYLIGNGVPNGDGSVTGSAELPGPPARPNP